MIGIPETNFYAQRIVITPNPQDRLHFIVGDQEMYTEICNSDHPGIMPSFTARYTKIVNDDGVVVWDRNTDGFYRTVEVHEYRFEDPAGSVAQIIKAVRKELGYSHDEEKEPTKADLDELEKELEI